MPSKGQLWTIDASIAFIIILVLSQLSLMWLDSYVESGKTFDEWNEKQLELIAASDRLINDPDCLAREDGTRTLPQTINLSKKPEMSENCHKEFDIDVNHQSFVVKRLVFLDEEGGEVGVLEVW